jgi:XTP/dITP diphosphohydrolase
VLLLAKATGQWALADDSGLCVEALGGAPGVHSARYGNTDLARIERLLAELEAINSAAQENINDTKLLDKREAYFVSALAISDPSGTIRFQAEGRCKGNRTLTHGFVAWSFCLSTPSAATETSCKGFCV